MRALLASGAFAASPCFAADAGPSIDCSAKLTRSVERHICSDLKLATLDRELAAVYASAQAKSGQGAPDLTATQRAWVVSRNDCWKSNDMPACVLRAYRDRISELQARYRLLEPVGTGRFLCPGTPPQPVVAEFFATDPPTAMVEFAGVTQFMRVAPSGSGARYTGGNRRFWEHQGVALLSWDIGKPELHCSKQ
ncbi:MAG: MliC family protein [Burkholderiales bacterium]|nr:MliC family protein [Burkholderiales bacterium]